MGFMIGLLSGVGLFVVVGISLYIGYRLGNKRVTPIQADSEEVRRAKELHQGFLQVMNYDVSKALERKKVKHGE